MKLLPALIGVVALSAVAIGVHAQTSQPQPYKVVFDLTSSDPIDQQAVLRWITEVKAVNPTTETEVVMYGPDGIGEIVAKQRAGWGYIKVAH
jgi:intracellular sulfur oxidation DsrE/DsrF family protein